MTDEPMKDGFNFGQDVADETQQDVLERRDVRAQAPSLYQVLLLNDDFTPMEFVVMLLKDIFHRSEEEAMHIMLQTHHEGKGVCGIFTKDVAETKMIQVINTAREHNYPLKCIIHRD